MRPTFTHWYRPGVDIARGTGHPVTACRLYLSDVGTFHTANYVLVSCQKCIAIMPDHLATGRAMVRTARGLPV